MPHSTSVRCGLLGDDRKLDDADRVVLSRPDMAASTRETTQDLVDGGVWGWVDDDLAFVKPWGFDLSEIEVPVRVTYGQRDVLVPVAHGAWLGRNIPGAEVIVDPSAGHLSDLDTVIEATHWLVTGDRALQTIGNDPHVAPGADHPLTQTRSHRQRVRGSPRGPGHRETPDPEMVRECGDIAAGVDHRPVSHPL